MEKSFINLEYFYHDKNSNFKNNNSAYTSDKRYSSTNDKPNTTSKLIDDLLRDTNDIAKLTSFNDYANELKTWIKHFLFCMNITNISDIKLFLNGCTP